MIAPPRKNEAARTALEGANPGQENRLRKFDPTSKRASVVRELVARGPKGMTCFEAVTLCHDYVLRSTISDVARDYGLRFDREPEDVPNSFGSTTRCVRYFLTGDQRTLARFLLGEIDTLPAPHTSPLPGDLFGNVVEHQGAQDHAAVGAL